MCFRRFDFCDLRSGGKTESVEISFLLATLNVLGTPERG